jgi:maleylacetoacetate isomerase/maleylpyruvate isomerase
MQKFELYNYFRSSTSYRARIALELKGLSYEYKPIHLLNNGGEQNSEVYRKLNPIGGVPTLVHGERVISQSFAIIEYLNLVVSDRAELFSSDAFINAKIRQFCEIINADTHPLTNLKVLQYLEKNASFGDPEKTQWIHRWMGDGFRACEKLAEEFSGRFCFGDTPTAADIFLIPQMFSSQRFKVDLTPFPKIQEINKNCLELEAFKRAHPFRQIDTPEEFRII